MRPVALALLLALLLAGCSAQSRARTPGFDTPVPPNEPRAQLELTVELSPVSDCDERFALALYEDRGVELLSWHEAGQASPHCSERRVTVRYLPRLLTREALLRRIRELSGKAELVKR